MALPDARGWRLAGALANGGTVSLGIDGMSGSYTLTAVATDNGGNQTTTTGADGSYSFNNLNPGTYRVAETQPAAWADSANGWTDKPSALTSPTVGTPCRRKAAIFMVVLRTGDV